MTYLIEKNERRHRRNAKLLTALIMITLFTIAAYYSGALDQVILEYTSPNVAPTAVANVTAA